MPVVTVYLQANTLRAILMATIHPKSKKDKDAFGSIDKKPMGKIRQIIAQNMQQSWTTIPHVTHHDEVDISAVLKTKKELNELLSSTQNTENGKHTQITVLPFVIKGLIKTLKSYPELNASYDDKQNSVVIKHYYNIGIAVDTPLGLIVPVIKNADDLSISELAVAIQDLSKRAKEGSLGFSDIEGGSFSVTSLGKQGGIAFTPIIKPTEVAILGISRILTKATPENNKVVISKFLPLSLSYDHRVIDGALASRFMTDLRQTLVQMNLEVALI